LSHIAIVELHSQIRHDSVLVVLFVNVHGESVIIGQSRNQFEKVHGIGTHNNLVGDAAIHLELIGVEDDTNQHGMGLVKVDDAHTFFSKSDGGIG